MCHVFHNTHISWTQHNETKKALTRKCVYSISDLDFASKYLYNLCYFLAELLNKFLFLIKLFKTLGDTLLREPSGFYFIGLNGTKLNRFAKKWKEPWEIFPPQFTLCHEDVRLSFSSSYCWYIFCSLWEKILQEIYRLTRFQKCFGGLFFSLSFALCRAKLAKLPARLRNNINKIFEAIVEH